MKDKNLDILSQMTSTSKSTVSRSLNHCPGVDHETRKKVLEAARKLNIAPGEGKKTDIYVIIPDNPKYFWSPAFDGLMSAADESRCKFNVYTSLNDSEEVEEYLLEALGEHAKILIISASYSPKVYEMLKAVSEKIPILFLEEYFDFQNTFFIGNDSYQDGALLGKVYHERFSEYHHIICFELKYKFNIQQRIKGFADTLQAGPDRFQRIEIPPLNKSFASQLARLLDGAVKKDALNCIYCADGILPQVCLAVAKIGCQDNVICLGFENPGGNREYLESGVIGAAVEQDIFLQGQKAMQYAMQYISGGTLPQSKITYVESKLITK